MKSLQNTPIPLSQRTQRMRSSVIREMLKNMQTPGLISFAGGNPAPESFPMTLFAELQLRALDRFGSKALQYSETEGFAPFREQLCMDLRQKGIPTSPEQILVTAGSQSALDLLAKVLLDQGTPIGVENPTYLGALQAFSPFSPEFIPLQSDTQGVLPLSLEEFLLTHGPSIVYLMPTFQNPTGNCMGKTRRIEIAQLFQKYGGLLIEDDPYSDLRYDGESLTPISAYCPENAIYLGTLSKVFAPGLRLGFCSAPQWLMPWMVIAKQGTDLHTSTLSQAMAFEYMQGGFLKQQLPRIIQLYRTRRDAMQNALEHHFSDTFYWEKPQGGMFFWLEGKPNFNSNAFAKMAIAQGVSFVPGSAFSPTAEYGAHCLRLNFSYPTPEEIPVGMARLAKALQS